MVETHETLPAVPDEKGALSSLSQLQAQRETYVRTGLQGAANTVRGYASDLRHYLTWCEEQQREALPATVEVLGLYLTQMGAQKKWATISRRLAALRKWHDLNIGKEQPSALDTPAIKALLKGIQKTHGVRQKQAQAFSLAAFKRRLSQLPTEAQGAPLLTNLRDKAMLLLGISGAFRRSELVQLNVENLRFDDEALVIALAKSKTNQKGEWEEKAVFYSPDAALCPVRTLRQWLVYRETETGLPTGPLFVRIRKGMSVTRERLSDKAVDRLVKAYLGDKYSAHSLRATFVTEAKLNGADDSEIMQQTKHKTAEMIRRYTRIDDVKKHNAAKKLNL